MQFHLFLDQLSQTDNYAISKTRASSWLGSISLEAKAAERVSQEKMFVNKSMLTMLTSLIRGQKIQPELRIWLS